VERGEVWRASIGERCPRRTGLNVLPGRCYKEILAVRTSFGSSARLLELQREIQAAITSTKLNGVIRKVRQS
jgi:hypothetical protein